MSTFSYRLRLTMFDGSKVEVVTGAADMIRLERQFDIAAAELATNRRLEWLIFLAYSALVRQANNSGPPPCEWDDFWGQVQEVELDIGGVAPGEVPAVTGQPT